MRPSGPFEDRRSMSNQNTHPTRMSSPVSPELYSPVTRISSNATSQTRHQEGTAEMSFDPKFSPLSNINLICPSGNPKGPSTDEGSVNTGSAASETCPPRSGLVIYPPDYNGQLSPESQESYRVSPIDSRNQGFSNIHPDISTSIPTSVAQEFDHEPLTDEETLEPIVPDGLQSPPHEKSSTSTSLPIKESLGYTACFSIIGGQLLLLATLGFLAFLWSGHGSAPEGAEATSLWRQIATHRWMIQTITLCSLIIRFIISAQSVLCTSMVASLSLERQFVRKSQAAWFSVMRSINDGPRQLLQLMLSSRTSRVFYQCDFWLIFLVAVATIGLQFTSTILLSDLHDSIIVSDSNSTLVRDIILYDENTSFAYGIDRTWVQRTPVYAIYGEVPTESDATPNMNGHSDTGVVQRSFLPITGSDNRTMVRTYEGNAFVMNSRVTCIPPRMTQTQFDHSASGMIFGELHYRDSLKDAQLDSDTCDSVTCNDRGFICMFPVQGSLEPTEEVYEWQSSLCLLSGDGNFYADGAELKSWDVSDDPWSHNTTTWLVFTSNMQQHDYINMPFNRPLSFESETTGQEWSTFKGPRDRALNATLCFSNYNLQRNSVKMAASETLREPAVSWSLIEEGYDTKAVRNYIIPGAPGGDLGKRGILELNILGSPNDGDPSSRANALSPIVDSKNESMTIAKLTQDLMALSLYGALNLGSNTTLSGCFNCVIQSTITHPEIGMVFSDIISTTGRAAIALQSFLTTLTTTIYENYAESLKGLGESQIAKIMVVPTPGPCSEHMCYGLISVTILVGLHLICTTIITMLYVRKVQYSRYANVWHTISQLVGEESKEIINESNNSSDKATTNRIKSEGSDNFITLGTTEHNGRVGMINYVLRKEYNSETTRFQKLRKFMKDLGKKSSRKESEGTDTLPQVASARNSQG